MAKARDVQERLRALGYYDGKIDGALGGVSCAGILAALEGVDVRALPVKINRMVTSPAGRAAIAQREGNKLKAYRDGGGVLTIGVGHTSAAGPPAVTAGMTITAAESDAILSRDLATFDAGVRDAVKVAVSQNEFDAMVSLAFNVGLNGFSGSSIIRRLNAGDRPGAANAFRLWNKDNGKIVAGLTKRREAERLQFLTL